MAMLQPTWNYKHPCSPNHATNKTPKTRQASTCSNQKVETSRDPTSHLAFRAKASPNPSLRVSGPVVDRGLIFLRQAVEVHLPRRPPLLLLAKRAFDSPGFKWKVKKGYLIPGHRSAMTRYNLPHGSCQFDGHGLVGGVFLLDGEGFPLEHGFVPLVANVHRN